MRAFPDLFETVTAAAPDDAERNLTTTANVKTALRISDSNSDALIDFLIPRASKEIVDYCGLSVDISGNPATFARETLRATWMVDAGQYVDDRLAATLRGWDIFLPWRLPVASIDTVIEDGIALAFGTDYQLMAGRGGFLRRMSADTPAYWSTGKIVVTFKAGFASRLSTNVDKSLEAAAIEQVKATLFAADRDPNIRSESSPDIGSVTYSVTGGDVLLPAVRSMLAPWRKGGAL